MAKENDCENCDKFDIAALRNEIADTKKKLDEFTAKNTELQGKLTAAEKTGKEATDSLNQYREAEKKALLDSIAKRTDFKVDDIKDKSVEELRTINATVDHIKPPEGTVKNTRGAGEPLPKNRAADGRIDPTKSIMGNPKRNADGSFTWVVD
jgi:predicted RNase H-like nuclease (RuvC/YqgF family)